MVEFPIYKYGSSDLCLTNSDKYIFLILISLFLLHNKTPEAFALGVIVIWMIRYQPIASTSAQDA